MEDKNAGGKMNSEMGITATLSRYRKLYSISQKSNPTTSP
jgi:hypothetical protein